jgi:hypothetical protein
MKEVVNTGARRQLQLEGDGADAFQDVERPIEPGTELATPLISMKAVVTPRLTFSLITFIKVVIRNQIHLVI